MKQEDIKIITGDKKEIVFSVEIPETEKEFCTGLAYRKSVPEKTGMLYYYGRKNSYISMFTPETEIPVDFIFLDDNGKIVKISTAKPLSKELHMCFNVAAALELNAGECKKYNICIGDTVIYHKFKNLNAFNSKIEAPDVNYFVYNRQVFAENPKTKDLYMYFYMGHSWDKIYGEGVDENFSTVMLKKFDSYKENKLERKDITKTQAEEIINKSEDLFTKDFKNHKVIFFVFHDTNIVMLDDNNDSYSIFVYGKGFKEITWLDEKLKNFVVSVKCFFVQKTIDEIKEIISAQKEEDFQALNRKVCRFFHVPKGYFDGEHCESLDEALNNLDIFDDNGKEGTNDIETIFKKSKENCIELMGIRHYITNKICSLYPFMKGAKNDDLTIETMYIWENKQECEIEANFKDITDISFYVPSYYQEKNKYKVNKKSSFYLSALACDIQKTEPNSFKIDSGATYDFMLKRFLEENPTKTKKDYPYVEIETGKASMFLPTEDASYYQFQSNISKVEHGIFGKVKITILDISVIRDIEKGDLHIKLYVPEKLLKGYKPKVDDNITGTLWLSGYIK